MRSTFGPKPLGCSDSCMESTFNGLSRSSTKSKASQNGVVVSPTPRSSNVTPKVQIVSLRVLCLSRENRVALFPHCMYGSLASRFEAISIAPCVLVLRIKPSTNPTINFVPSGIRRWSSERCQRGECVWLQSVCLGFEPPIPPSCELVSNMARVGGGFSSDFQTFRQAQMALSTKRTVLSLLSLGLGVAKWGPTRPPLNPRLGRDVEISLAPMTHGSRLLWWISG